MLIDVIGYKSRIAKTNCIYKSYIFLQRNLPVLFVTDLTQLKSTLRAHNDLPDLNKMKILVFY